MREAEFVETAFSHGFHEEDFFELLSGRYIKLRSQRGITDVFELLGQNFSGDYLHIIYRILKSPNRIRIFHMSQMTENQKRRFKQWLRK
jgi:hypothetical protein